MAFGNYIPEQRNSSYTTARRGCSLLFLMDHAPDAVFWVAPDARFLYVNDPAAGWVFP